MKRIIIFLMIILNLKNFTIEAVSITSLVDQSGIFQYGGNIIAEPTDPNDAIISIITSNVIIDLGEHVLTQSSTNSVPGLIGVFVAPNLTNITIRNGTIADLSGIGVYIGDGCSEIFLENLLITSCAQTGVLFDGISFTGTGITNGVLTNCTVTSCTGVDGNPAYGLRMVASRNFQVIDSIFNNNDAIFTSSGYGVSLESCANCELRNCRSFTNGGNQLGVGISLVNSSDCAINKCISNNNLSHSVLNSSTGCGFFVNSCSAVSFSLCRAFGNSNIFAHGIGFGALNGSGTSSISCLAQKNIGGITAAGFLLTGTEANVSLQQNIAVANIASFISGSAYGIYVNGPQGCAINDNIIAANIGAQGFGLFDTTTDTNNFISGNLSYANTTTGYVVNFTSGTFPVFFASNNNFAAIENTGKYVNVAIV